MIFDVIYSLIFDQQNGLRDEPQSAGGGNCIFFHAIYRASRPSAAKPRAKRAGSARLRLIGGARAAPINLNWLISQPDRADGRRPSELQRAVRPIAADNLDKKRKLFGSELIRLFGDSTA